MENSRLNLNHTSSDALEADDATNDGPAISTSDSPNLIKKIGETTSSPLNMEGKDERTRSNEDTSSDSSPGASPPRKKLISDLKEKMIDESRAQKMKLAHEIAFDANFKLPDEPSHPSPDDKSKEAKLKRFEQNIKDIVHRAFWDCLRSGIESDPPTYDHAFTLLQEIKDTLLSLLPTSRTTAIHRRIEDYMDLDFLRQQADNDTLNVKSIATFIVDTMASICAPVRDDQIAELRSIEDIVDLFKAIYELLGRMKIDFANFAIASIRPYIRQKEFEYERTQFAKLLKSSPDLKNTRKWIYKSYERIQVGLQHVRQEMEKNKSNTNTSADLSTEEKYSEIEKLKLSPFSILKEAYSTILSDELNLNELPETFEMDRERIRSLRDEIGKIVLVSAVMITSCGVFNQPIASHQQFLVTLKEHLVTLVTPEENKDISDVLDSMALQCWKDAVDYTHDKDPSIKKCVKVSNEGLLRNQIIALKDRHAHPVCKLFYNRTVEYLQQAADILSQHSSTTSPTLPHPPTGLSFMLTELVNAALQYAKLVNMNRTIYGPFYIPILREVTGPYPPDENANTFSRHNDAQENSDSAEISDSCESANLSSRNYKVTGSLEDLD